MILKGPLSRSTPLLAAFVPLLALSASNLCSILVAEEHRDLIVVAGQSNAVGFDALAEEIPPHPVDQKALFWFRVGDPPPDEHDSTSSSRWQSLGAQPKGNPIPRDAPPEKLPPEGKNRQYGNFKSPHGGFGPEIGFARTLASLPAPQNLAILKVAFSGTSLQTDWNPKAPTGNGPEGSGACLRALRSEIRSAIAAATARGIHLHPRAILWVQGESDSNAKDAPLYADTLTEFLQVLRSDLQAPSLPAFLAINPHFGNDKNPFVAQIIAAQKSVATRSQLAKYVDTEAAETLRPSQTHFTTQGTLEVGRLFAKALLDWEKTHPNP